MTTKQITTTRLFTVCDLQKWRNKQ